jgi:hypothetical protein
MDQERRRRARLSLCYRLQLRRVEGQVSLEAETDNISGGGFYCVASEPFSPGEYLECGLVIPGQSPPLILRRLIRVIRVEIKGMEPGFGVACEFADPQEVNLALGDGTERLRDGAIH